jgi:hypothetical protein
VLEAVVDRNSFVFWHLTAAFALLMLFAPALHAQAPNQASPQNLTCSPAPCVFPNVQVSGGGYEVVSNVIVANPSDPSQMLAGVEDYNCDSRLGIFSSQDGGATWTHACLPMRPGGQGIGAPVIAYDLNGVAYAGGLQEPILNQVLYVVLWSSADNGRTWQEPALVLKNAVKPWLEIDTNAGSPFRNTLYVAATHYSVAPLSYFEDITVSHSNDGGKTWNSQAIDRKRLPLVNNLSDLAIARDGTVYVTWLSCKLRGGDGSTCGGSLATLWISSSVDGGNTWSAPINVAETRLAPDPFAYSTYGLLPGTQAPVTNIPVVAVDDSSQPTAGNVYVAFYNYNGTQMQLGVATSTDHGSTWSAPLRVSQSNRGDEFFQWISVAADGTIGVTWLDRRADYFDYQPMFAVSKDGGASFSSSATLSTTLSDPTLIWPGGSYMGDYRTHVWVGNALYATWQDTRTGDGEVELGGVQF